MAFSSFLSVAVLALSGRILGPLLGLSWASLGALLGLSWAHAAVNSHDFFSICKALASSFDRMWDDVVEQRLVALRRVTLVTPVTIDYDAREARDRDARDRDRDARDRDD